MKRYNNKMIASVGYYLTDSNGKRGFALPFAEGVTYTETEVENWVEKRPYNSASIGGVFNIQVTDHIKKTLVTSIWSNDDQIAIILNKDNGESEMYDFMQAWRDWFGEVARQILSLE